MKLSLPTRLAAAMTAWSYQFFEGGTEKPTERPYLPETAMGDFDNIVGSGEQTKLADVSRKMFGNFGPVMGCYSDIVIFSVGNAWVPLFDGVRFPDWGEQAEEWLTRVWMPQCDIGGIHNFNSLLALEVFLYHYDGEYFELYTYDPDDKFPLIQVLSRFRFGGDEEVLPQGHPYAGCKLSNGIIEDPNYGGRVVAYNLLGLNGDTDEAISAQNICHVYDPHFTKQGRGLPAATPALDDLRDAMLSKDWEKINYLVSSAQTIIEYNDIGSPSPGGIAGKLLQNAPQSTAKDANGNDVTPQPPKVQAQPTLFKKLYGGAIKYFRANSGSKIEQHVNMRPGDDWDKFTDRLLRNFYTSVCWPMELTWKLDALNGPGTYVLLDKARAKIADVQSIIRPSAIRKITYAISFAIEQDILDECPEWDMWAFTKPPQFVGNQSKDRDQSRRDYFAGITNLEDQLERLGKGKLRPHLMQRGRAEQMKDQIAKLFGVDVSRLGTDNPNGAQPTEPNNAASAHEIGTVIEGMQKSLANLASAFANFKK